MTDTTLVASALRKDLLKGIALWDADKQPNEGERLAGGNLVNDTQSFIKISQFTRPMGPRPVAERQLLPEGRYNKVRDAQYTTQAYGFLMSFSKEVWRDNQYPGVLMQTYGEDGRDLCHDVRDIALVNEFFNLVDTNTGADGRPHADNVHPLDSEAAELTESGTATHSNIMVGNPVASTEALNDGVDQLMREVDNKGRIKSVLPPVVIECDSKRKVTWNSIKNPVNGYEYGNADHNNGKVYAEMISEVIGLTRSTHRERFCLRSANKKKHFRWIWDRQGTEVSEMKYIHRDRTMEVAFDFRLAKGFFHWGGQVWSLAGV